MSELVRDILVECIEMQDLYDAISRVRDLDDRAGGRELALERTFKQSHQLLGSLCGAARVQRELDHRYIRFRFGHRRGATQAVLIIRPRLTGVTVAAAKIQGRRSQG